MSPVQGGWDPGQYHRFSDHRRRPAIELLARVPPAEPGLVLDLGCGSGELTRLLAKRWPHAAVVGIDSSADMLERARAGGDEEVPARIEWVEADVADWAPTSPPGLVFANASLQWVDGHRTLFPRLFRSLTPGGVLAVQMPLSRESRSHLLMHEVLATAGPGDTPIGPPALRREIARKWVLDPMEYLDLLEPDAARLDVWTTEYLQILEGEDPVLEWVRGTGLRPILNGLAEADLLRFLDAYRPALREAYPRRPDGTTVYPFRRLFLIAVRV